MKFLSNLLIITLFLAAHSQCKSQTTHLVSPHALKQLGQKIWQRECGGSVAGLTCWNNGEEFPSLGIGHFIWYPAGKTKIFEETFPALLNYLIEHTIILPDWLIKAKENGCPWHTQKEFNAAQTSEKMNQLRTLLHTTIDLQAEFIITQANNSMMKIIGHAPVEKKEDIERKLSRLKNTNNGLYALIDYLHFKGSGTNPAEQYHNQGWGLLQILESMELIDSNPLQSFVNTAKNLLITRVKNSPPERNEARWLPGWLNRVESYLVQF